MEQQFEYLEEDEDFLSTDSEKNSGSFEDDGTSLMALGTA